MKNSSREVSFYCLTKLPVFKAAPKLIEKVYYSNQRLVVITPDEQSMKIIDDVLWSYSTKHFIPHATYLDDSHSDQPVYITINDENPNCANIIMSIGNAEIKQNAEKLIHLFDGNDKDQLEFARNKWREYKSKDFLIIYWKQNHEGAWEKQT